MHEVVRTRYTAYWESSYVDVVGIDVSKDDFHACLLQRTGQTSKSFPNSTKGYKQMVSWLRNRRCIKVHACMEATGAYWLGIATVLHHAGVDVSVVNPSQTAFFARSQLRRTKTDNVDAQMIADFCKTQKPSLWTPPAPETLELRGLLTYRDQLVAEKVRLKQVAAQVHLTVDLRKLHAKQIRSLENAIAAVEKSMRSLVRGHDKLALQVEKLNAIDGIGFITAAAIVAKLPIDRLRDQKAAAAYVGLSPRERQSGTSVNGKPRICKTGNAELRRDLYMPAIVATRHNAVLRTFAEQLAARGKAPKVIIVAVMRKLIVLAFRLLTEPNFRLAVNP